MRRMSKKQQLNDNEESVLKKSMYTGFIGGVLFSLLASAMYYFNFLEVNPKSYLLTSWVSNAWTDTWLGVLFTTILAGVVSLLVAFLYYLVFRKIKYMWVGIVYGFILWTILFLLFRPIFSDIPAVMEWSLNTWITTICLFILYGTFIGYSISYDYMDSKQTEDIINKS
ncbi:YqhR family membrane protein [Oceanobacillus jeddahense]|uniref:YqhR family membrane protein n=1 Tax=Oceanobacillus jeddahense TaxID=1462527 RepID=UPI0006938BFB|nr:YqhR family membrane protein [Oceanobacillus jeddahense]